MAPRALTPGPWPNLYARSDVAKSSPCRRCGKPSIHHNRHYCSPVCEFWHRHRVDEASGCWVWTGPKTMGYGRMGFDQLAHRVAYELFVGPIPVKYQIDHLCRNRPCVNPAHLEAVTQAENIRREMAFRPLVTHCRRAGHPYTAANTYVLPNGKRVCRTCRRLREGRAIAPTSSGTPPSERLGAA